MVSYIRRVMSVSWLATTILIMPEITIHIDQLLDMCSSLVQEKYPGVVKQPIVSLSTIETEYRAGAMAAQKSTRLMQLMKYLNQPIDYAVPLYCDN